MYTLDQFSKTQLTLEQCTDDAERIAQRCCEELVGYSPLIQATALLDVHATFLSGFTLEARAEVLDMHMRSVLRLAQIKCDERAHENREAN